MTYISGPMTGYADYNRQSFFDAAKYLRKGANVINPAEFPSSDEMEYADYMKRDISALLLCDSIYMLKGWKDSKGANLEYQIAKVLGYNIMEEK